MQHASLGLNQIVTSGQRVEDIDGKQVMKYWRTLKSGLAVPTPLVVPQDLVLKAASKIGDTILNTRLQFLAAMGAEYYILDGNHRLNAMAMREKRMPVHVVANNQDYQACLQQSRRMRQIARLNFREDRLPTFEMEIYRLAENLNERINAFNQNPIYTLQEQEERLVADGTVLSKHRNADICRVHGWTRESVQRAIASHDLATSILTSNSHLSFENIVKGKDVTEEAMVAGIISERSIPNEFPDTKNRDDAIRRIILKNPDPLVIFDAFGAASKEIRSDPDLVLAAVSINGYCLMFASEKLRADRKIVLAAITSEGDSFEFASEELRGERDLLMLATETGDAKIAFHDASEKLRSTPEIIRICLPQNPWITQTIAWDKLARKYALEFAAQACKLSDDPEVRKNIPSELLRAIK